MEKDSAKVPKYSVENCDVCNGSGKINNVFTCGKCSGRKTIDRKEWVTGSNDWKMVGQEKVIQISINIKKEEINEYVYASYTNEALHKQGDLFHKGIGAYVHGFYAPGDSYFYETDINKLNSGVTPIRKQKYIINTLYELGDSVFALNGEYIKYRKCNVCHGAGSTVFKRYKHVCRTCRGEGLLKYKYQRYKIVEGLINGIEVVMGISGSIAVFYEIVSNDHIQQSYQSYHSELVSKKESDIHVKAKEEKFTNQVTNLW